MELYREVSQALINSDISFRSSVWGELRVMTLADGAPVVIPIPLKSFEDLHLKDGFQEQIWEQWPGAIILWEDVWLAKRDIVLSRWNAFIGTSRRVHGRQTKVVVIQADGAQAFLNQNHLMGYTKAKYHLGLEIEGLLVAVASFGRAVSVSRDFGQSQSHELIRFCYKLNTHVQGGLSKLLSYFVAEFNPGDIYTSVDREWSDGSGYKALGFEVFGTSPSIPFWIDTSLERHRTQVDNSFKITNAGNLKMLWIPQQIGS